MKVAGEIHGPRPLKTALRPRSFYTGRKAVYRQGWEIIFIRVHEGTVNPLLPPGSWGAYLFQTHLRRGGGGGGLNWKRGLI